MRTAPTGQVSCPTPELKIIARLSPEAGNGPVGATKEEKNCGTLLLASSENQPKSNANPYVNGLWSYI